MHHKSVTRFDETWHRLLDWTAGQTPSERLAALMLDEEGYESIDPAHPLGGKDGGADALVYRDSQLWIMAVYFPRGQQTIGEITAKLTSDVAKAKTKRADLVGVAFVTNQELRLSEREALRKLGGGIEIDLFHLERLTTILDRPRMAGVREQFLYISAGPPPILVKVDVLGSARAFDCADDVLNMLVEVEQGHLEKRNEALRNNPPDPLSFLQLSGLGSMGYGVPEEAPKPLSVDEIQRRVALLRSGMEGRWATCQDYLAAVAWPALHFKVENLAQSFLTNVQIILTFHGGRGLEFVPPEEFEWERLKDPAWEPPTGPYGLPPISMPSFTPAGYPISWENNDDGDLEVTIDLPELRPHPAWRHRGDDVVLIARDGLDDALTVTYTVTAGGYGTAFEGEPMSIPVEHVDMIDSVQQAYRASRSDN